MNNISVNVDGLESKFENNQISYETVGSLRYVPKKLSKHIDLLLIIKDCDIVDKNHSCQSDCGKP